MHNHAEGWPPEAALEEHIHTEHPVVHASKGGAVTAHDPGEGVSPDVWLSAHNEAHSGDPQAQA